MAATQTNVWIRNPQYDMLFVMGGAFLTLMVPILVSGAPALLPFIFWGWIVFFEGSHFWATFSRTYIDADFRRENPGFLTGSLVFFLIPVLMVVLDRQNPNAQYMNLYGFFIFLWSLYHNARQHFGFVSIYNQKSGSPSWLQGRYKGAIYAAVVAPQIFFLLNHKMQTAFTSFPKPEVMDPALHTFLNWGPRIATTLTVLYLLKTLYDARREGVKALGIPFVYCTVCITFYSLMFYVVAPREPFFLGAANGAQLYMVIAVMNSLFHNIQYHAIVWHYSKKRYAESPAKASDYGIARWVGANGFRYSGVALSFGLVFGVIVWNLGDWPSPWGTYSAGAGPSAWAYCLFFGIIGHHFYLDQKIWRPSRQKELSVYLGLRAAA